MKFTGCFVWYTFFCWNICKRLTLEQKRLDVVDPVMYKGFLVIIIKRDNFEHFWTITLEKKSDACILWLSISILIIFGNFWCRSQLQLTQGLGTIWTADKQSHILHEGQTEWEKGALSCNGLDKGQMTGVDPLWGLRGQVKDRTGRAGSCLAWPTGSAQSLPAATLLWLSP